MIEITLSGPGKNALSTEIMSGLIARLHEAAGQPVLLTGTGDAFCAGLDLRELAGLDDAGMEAFLRKLEEMVLALHLYPGPTVAWINGHAIAGGAVVALACDRIVATDAPKARIGLNEVALGLLFPPVTLAMIRQRLCPRWATEVLFGARLYDPQSAWRVGLVDEVAGDASVAREWLDLLAAHPAANYGATKRLLRQATVLAAGDEAAFRAILPTWTSPEIRARIAGALKR